MTDEQKAEIQRLRKIKEMFGSFPIAESLHALRVVADMALAEHPADDAEPVTKEWVKSFCLSLPLEPIDGEAQWHWLPDKSRVFLRWNDYGEDGKSGVGHWSANTSGSHLDSWIEFAIVKTRGDVRRLCAVVGVESK